MEQTQVTGHNEAQLLSMFLWPFNQTYVCDSLDFGMIFLLKILLHNLVSSATV